MKNCCFALLFLMAFGLSGCKPSRPSGGEQSGTPPKQLLLRDEGLSQLSYVDLAHPEKNWYVPIPNGRDLQLVGRGRVLVGTGDGYEEHDIKTGNKVSELNIFKGTIAARRLRNGNTLLTGLNWQGKEGIVLVEVGEGGSVIKTINYPGFSYVRLVRETATDTFLITSDDTVFEGKSDGTIIWRAKLNYPKKGQHAWQAVRLADGRTLVSGGFSANLQILAPDGTLKDTLGGPSEVHPYFYAGFQILKSGNIVVTNWQGHGEEMGAKGTQLLEYSPMGQLVWSWQQDPARFSSIQGVIILDGLDLDRPHGEDKDGKLTPF
ncbi:hypothetical protein [Salmonirosea aquatica]|uniref:PQQ-binding-like beta-propeller repeat protein n=1 Tax=Salmonirosea aquatica TaxID=2654236 RepID=A0A7C9BC06_9BACT|nr:hypothetical protein [Cytophagaceae bacterium SJW1-29]